MKSKLKQVRTLLLTLVVVLTVVDIVFLSPGHLEQADSEAGPTILDPKVLIGITMAGATVSAPGVPHDRIPDYGIDRFNYVSTEGVHKQWRLVARLANLYNENRLVYARDITAYLFNPQGEPTVVTGREAKFFMDDKEVEIFTNVRTVFPDGFEIHSEYLKYNSLHREITIPKDKPVKGIGVAEGSKRISFESRGMEYEMDNNEILLPREVIFNMERTGPRTRNTRGVADRTTIRSDQCRIDRESQIAHFSMFDSRPESERFVNLKQPGLSVKSRIVELNYGDFSEILQYITSRQDVTIFEENEDERLRYATCGKVEFDTHDNLIRLSRFPQVYQDKDTVTGEIIVIHRDTDEVEVQNSNAFSEGITEDY